MSFYIDYTDGETDEILYTVAFRKIGLSGDHERWYIELQDEEEDIVMWFELDIHFEAPTYRLIAKAFEYIEEHT